jgi:hypothetical protein
MDSSGGDKKESPDKTKSDKL